MSSRPRSFLAVALLTACASPPTEMTQDLHSFATPGARVTHVSLDLELDFTHQVVRGHADLQFTRSGGNELCLDSQGLVFAGVEALGAGGGQRKVTFSPEQPHLGTKVAIALEPTDRAVRVHYATKPGAAALQWLAAAQTHDRRAPFLYTQGQAILTRSWIPLQDSPGVRITYDARVRAPEGLTVLMSAERQSRDQDGAFRFKMPQAIPPYLIALACGQLEFAPIGERCGVWAEPSVLPRAASELEDMEKMLLSCEQAFGAYRWGRYEVLILPPAFPFGGMENPRLTFATPTILAGDKSLVGLIAHELAHSWSGNLVTNATWRDFWLNEGCTVFLENRIMELVFGKERAAMEFALGMEQLAEELKELPPGDQVLHIDLTGRNPDDNMTAVPYEKGAAFLHRLEQIYGRQAFEKFLSGYFDAHAFQSITTAQFLAWLDRNLLATDRSKAAQIDIDRWVRQPGLPADAVPAQTSLFAAVDGTRSDWLAGKTAAAAIDTRGWTPHHWLRFLSGMPNDLTASRIEELDGAFHLTASGNSEIFVAWAKLALRYGYEPAVERVESFLMNVGRRKYVKPLYEALMQSEAGRATARRIYQQARPRYHAVTVRTLDEIVK